MNTIKEYQKRFNQLMESTMGDVKPLIMEQPSVDTQNIESSNCDKQWEILKNELDTALEQNKIAKGYTEWYTDNNKLEDMLKEKFNAWFRNVSDPIKFRDCMRKKINDWYVLNNQI